VQALFVLLHLESVHYVSRMGGQPVLIDLIRTEIQRAGGRITFARFMELALYHPQHGYYASGKTRIGKEGDYFTSVSVGPLFGRILARHFRQFRAELGAPAEFEVVEFGGHHGQLRADVLAAAPELRYRVVEVGEPLPDAIVGCVFSNEFLDALPVHRVQGDQEVYVTGDFTESLGPLSDARLPRLPEGYRSEFNLRALDWLSDVARRLRRGWVVTIDYGFEREEYFAPHHKDGHLQCYYRHQRGTDPYRHVGEQDITAHVEFSSLIEHGRSVGLEPVQFTDQAHYLLEIGETEIAEIVAREAGQLSKERSAIHQLIHPGLMGRQFRVLVQQKQQAVAFSGDADLSSDRESREMAK
jgi:SAM-dependent MidA family methyltransferase